MFNLNTFNEPNKLHGYPRLNTSLFPATVAYRSKVRTVFARSKAGIVGSKPTQGMDI
jgi:hypothetical protein